MMPTLNAFTLAAAGAPESLPLRLTGARKVARVCGLWAVFASASKREAIRRKTREAFHAALVAAFGAGIAARAEERMPEKRGAALTCGLVRGTVAAAEACAAELTAFCEGAGDQGGVAYSLDQALSVWFRSHPAPGLSAAERFTLKTRIRAELASGHPLCRDARQLHMAVSQGWVSPFLELQELEVAYLPVGLLRKTLLAMPGGAKTGVTPPELERLAAELKARLAETCKGGVTPFVGGGERVATMRAATLAEFVGAVGRIAASGLPEAEKTQLRAALFDLGSGIARLKDEARLQQEIAARQRACPRVAPAVNPGEAS